MVWSKQSIVAHLNKIKHAGENQYKIAYLHDKFRDLIF